MSEIEELQGRIAAALDRIGKGLESRGSGGGDAGEAETLRQELADEKLAAEQLKERVKRLRARREELEAQIEAAEASAAAWFKALDAELQSLRAANAQLRENNAALREANEAGVAEPHLINKAMMAELEGLRAARAADRAEAETLLAELGRAMDAAGDKDQSENA